MFLQSCAACEYAKNKSKRYAFDRVQSSMLVGSTLIIVGAHLVSASRSSWTSDIRVELLMLFAVEVALAFVWFHYLMNNVISWRGPGTYLDQADEVHSHLFVSKVWPALVHNAGTEYWSGGGSARVCSPIVFALSTGWFCKRMVFDVERPGVYAMISPLPWVVSKYSRDVVSLRDASGGQVRMTWRKALQILKSAGFSSLTKLFNDACRQVSDATKEIETLKQQADETERYWSELGRELTDLAVSARMEKNARSSPQARWMRVALEQVLAGHWHSEQVGEWYERAQTAHLHARVMIAEAVAQAEAR